MGARGVEKSPMRLPSGSENGGQCNDHTSVGGKSSQPVSMAVLRDWIEEVHGEEAAARFSSSLPAVAVVHS